MNFKISQIIAKIAAELAEGRRKNIYQQLSKKYPEEKISQIIKWVEEVDPTPKGKYTDWLIKIIKFQNPTEQQRTLTEDTEKIKIDLEKYQKLKEIRKLKPEHADITKLNRLNDLYQIIDQYQTEEEIKSRRQQEKEIKEEGVELVLDHPPYKVYEVTDENACPLMAAGSKWCVSDASTAGRYLRLGPLYFITKNGQKYALFHYGSKQFMNVLDQPLKGKEKWDLFKLLTPVTGKDIYYSPDITLDYRAEKNITERDPKLEEKIFKFHHKTEVQYLLIRYMKQIQLKERWPKAEEFINNINKVGGISEEQFYGWEIEYRNILGIKERDLDFEKNLYNYPWKLLQYMKNIRLTERIPEFEQFVDEELFHKNYSNWWWPLLEYMEITGMTEWPALRAIILTYTPDFFPYYFKMVSPKQPDEEFEKWIMNHPGEISAIFKYQKILGKKKLIPSIERKIKELEEFGKTEISNWLIIEYLSYLKERRPKIEEHFKKEGEFFNYVIGVGVDKFSKEDLKSIQDYPLEIAKVVQLINQALEDNLVNDVSEKGIIHYIYEFQNQESIIIENNRICLHADEPRYADELPHVAEIINQKFRKAGVPIQFDLEEAQTGTTCLPIPKELLSPNPFKQKISNYLQKIASKLTNAAFNYLSWGWLTPKGNIKSTDQGQTHLDLIEDNTHLFQRKGKDRLFYEDAFQEGWIRWIVKSYEISFEGTRKGFNTQQKAIQQLIDQNPNKFVIIDIVNDRGDIEGGFNFSIPSQAEKAFQQGGIAGLERYYQSGNQLRKFL